MDSRESSNTQEWRKQYGQPHLNTMPPSLTAPVGIPFPDEFETAPTTANTLPDSRSAKRKQEYSHEPAKRQRQALHHQNDHSPDNLGIPYPSGYNQTAHLPSPQLTHGWSFSSLPGLEPPGLTPHASSENNTSQLPYQLNDEYPGFPPYSTHPLLSRDVHIKEEESFDDSPIGNVGIKQEDSANDLASFELAVHPWTKHSAAVGVTLAGGKGAARSRGSGDVGNTGNIEERLPFPEDVVSNNFQDKPTKEETYSVGSSDEEEMAMLVDAVDAFTSPQVPPASVINELLTSPSSIHSFDPNLQHSSPAASLSRNTSQIDTTKSQPNQRDEELLDEDIDWDPVIETLASLPRHSDGSVHPPSPLPAPRPTFTTSKAPIPRTTTNLASPTHQPFTRTPFPSPLREKSPVAGCTNSTLLRTTFRIGQLISTANHHLHTTKSLASNQTLLFELYARVIASSRDPRVRIQHFTFVDLFKDQHPYPRGILEGWKSGSLLEKQSEAFLGASRDKPMMCRCICRVKKDDQKQKGSQRSNTHSAGVPSLGWTITVLWIRGVGWDEVEMMKKIVC